jgi:hypothetical protein
MIDGELSGDELTSVHQHLKNCRSCGQLHFDFAEVNKAVGALSANLTDASHDRVTETFVVTREKTSLKNWLSVWRLAPLAGVAALLVGFFVVTIQPPDNVSADQLSPEQFVKPMTELNRINQQQQRDQDLMLRTIGMDLRTLRLELKQLKSASPEEHTRIEEQIESMLQRVQDFELSAD